MFIATIVADPVKLEATDDAFEKSSTDIGVYIFGCRGELMKLIEGSQAFCDEENIACRIVLLTSWKNRWRLLSGVMTDASDVSFVAPLLKRAGVELGVNVGTVFEAGDEVLVEASDEGCWRPTPKPTPRPAAIITKKTQNIIDGRILFRLRVCEIRSRLSSFIFRYRGSDFGAGSSPLLS